MMRQFFTALLLVATVACGSENPAGSSSESEYISQIRAIIPREAEITDGYASVTGPNATTDAAFSNKMAEIIPKARALVVDLEAIRPPSKFRSVHEKLILAWNLQYDAFVLFVSAVQQGSLTIASQGNEKLAEARRLGREIEAEFAALGLLR